MEEIFLAEEFSYINGVDLPEVASDFLDTEEDNVLPSCGILSVFCAPPSQDVWGSNVHGLIPMYRERMMQADDK